MNNPYKIVATGALVMAAGCSIRRAETYLPECHPLPEPLLVDSGAVSIKCSETPGHSPDLDCTIVNRTGELKKTGIFMFGDRRQAPGFDPTDVNSYASWDGCFVIALRDGSKLEEVEIISSHAGAHADSKGRR